jgi:hypothetical protein
MDKNLFKGPSTTIEKEMLETLGLSSRVKFPTRRLVTLWKNTRWNSMITTWCSTALGQATFNLSTWDAMASCRIDDVSVEPRGDFLIGDFGLRKIVLV